MRIFSLAFLLGILLLQQFSFLPDKKWIPVMFVIAIIAFYWKFLRIPSAILLGFTWVLFYVISHTSWILPNTIEGKTIYAEGIVASIPDSSNHKTTFLFNLKKIEFENKSQLTKGFIKLSWHARNDEKLPFVNVGDQWKFCVRLKKIHSMRNPGSFDYEAKALQDDIRAQGYIVNKGKNQLLASNWYNFPLDRMRSWLLHKMEKVMTESLTSPWIIALILGERRGILEESWDILRKTGTNHLMAIAGLHIGFISGFAFASVSWIWRRVSYLSLRLPAQLAGASAALCIALIYSALAGFSLPTQRALIMLTVFLSIVLLRRKVLSWYALSVALLIVLLINPISVLTTSFWLSFGAVALIIYGVNGRLAPRGLWWKLGRIQWVVALGLIPFSLWLFQECSLISFFANSIAIPWVGFLILPLCVTGSILLLFSDKLGGIILNFADYTLSFLWKILTWFAYIPDSSWYHIIPNNWILIATCIGTILFLLPIGVPGRFLGALWISPLFFYKPLMPKLGEAWFTLLDVGQGLATVIQTKNHILIFDTGPKLSPQYDMGERVLVPYLRTIGAKQIDMLVVSHGDNDHIGGSAAVLKHFPVLQIKTSVPEKLSTPQTSFCLRGQSWDWDNVNFKFLYPTPANLGLKNDSSCVLKISTGNNHILLTGDIEKNAEENLIANGAKDLAANILVAPHHGSKTSGLTEFIEAVHPDFILFPIGYKNRYHFPHASVVAKYDALNSTKLDTVQKGAIKFVINNSQILGPFNYRDEYRRYWNC